MINMNYRYFKFKGGKYFRTIDEETFQTINKNNCWENDDMIYFLYYDVGVEYEEIIDEEILSELRNIPYENTGEIKK